MIISLWKLLYIGTKNLHLIYHALERICYIYLIIYISYSLYLELGAYPQFWNDFHSKIWMVLMCTGVVYTIEFMIITTPLLLCCGETWVKWMFARGCEKKSVIFSLLGELFFCYCLWALQKFEAPSPVLQKLIWIFNL